MKRGSGFVACVTILLAWGVLAFGAVYPWAYWPLAVGTAATGVYGLVRRRDVRGLVPGVGLQAAFAATFVAMTLQTIPVRRDTIAQWSPNTARLLQDYDVLYAAGAPRHALSLQPEATFVTVILFTVLVVFLFGATRALSLGASSRMTSAIVVLGVMVAVVGIVQKPFFYTGKIYGFWTPYGHGIPFGPFVNRNHYGGWMAMALSLSLGYFCGRVAQASMHIRPGFRNRLLWCV